MKLSFILLISVFLFSFGPTSEKVENSSRPGFYIVVEDYTDRTFHKYIVESKDSVGEINHPISIYNVKRSFYVARVTVYESSDGKKKFRNLKYASVYIKRSKLKPVIL